MKIFIVNGGHPTIQGNPMRPYATKEAANAFAAELVNIILGDYTDDESDQPIIAADATADTWMDKCLEYRQSIADDMECDLDDLEDDDAGDVWIVEEELIGGDEIYARKSPETAPRDWSPWQGGDEPPLPAGQDVEVLLRCGVERSGTVGEFGYANRWNHLNQPDDIMGFIPVPIVHSDTIKGTLHRAIDNIEQSVADAAEVMPDGEQKTELLKDLGNLSAEFSKTVPRTTLDAIGVQDNGGMTIGKTEKKR